MTNSQIVELIYKDDFYMNIIKKLTSNHQLADDLYQEVLLILLEQDNKKLNKAYKEKWIKYLFISIAKNQYHSSTSPFHKKYRKFNEQIDDNSDLSTVDLYTNYNNKLYNKLCEISINESNGDDIHNNIDKIEKAIESLHWYPKTLFKMRYKLGEYNLIDGIYKIDECNKDVMTYRKMEEITEIDHVSIHQTIKESIDIIRKQIKTKNI